MRFFDNKFFSNFIQAFPTPKYLIFDTVSLDISSDAVRVIRLKQSKLGLIPELFKEVRYVSPINFSDQNFKLEECEEILNILKTLKKELKICHVVVSLSEKDNYIYRTELPREALSDVASAVKFSLEDNVPISAVDCNFDYSIIDSTKKDKVYVIVNVYPKKVIQSYTDLLNRAGLVPVSFRPESEALAEAVISRFESEAIMLVRFLSNKTNISIVEDSVVQYTSEIWTGSNDLLGGLNNEKVESLKAELTKLLIFWFTNTNSGVMHKKISKVLLVGEKSTDQNIIDFLERHLKINVDTGNVWKNCFDLNKYIPPIEQKVASNYSVAIGLALKSNMRCMLNLLIKEDRNKIKKEYMTRVFNFFLISTIFLLFSFAVFKGSVLLFVNSEHNYYLAQKNAIEEKLASSEQNIYKQKIEHLEKEYLLFKEHKNFPSENIAKIFENKTKDIDISNIQVDYVEDGIKIKVGGIAKNRTALIDFTNTLKSNKEYETVDIPFSSFVKENDVPFLIDIKINNQKNANN